MVAKKEADNSEDPRFIAEISAASERLQRGKTQANVLVKFTIFMRLPTNLALFQFNDLFYSLSVRAEGREEMCLF